MTLNPPGAPACVRCNSPLTRDPLVGAKETGPGLAGSGRAAPWSSRQAAVEVQPPGFGLGTEEPPAPTGPSPAELRRVRRRITVAGLVLVALVLAGGGTALWLTRPRYVDTSAVAGTIGKELSARLGTTVTVSCDGSPKKEPGATFTCTASDGAGPQRSVTVTLVDDSGRYRWQLAG
jgi:Domain of unknown function (DUF4333)